MHVLRTCRPLTFAATCNAQIIQRVHVALCKRFERKFAHDNDALIKPVPQALWCLYKYENWNGTDGEVEYYVYMVEMVYARAAVVRERCRRVSRDWIEKISYIQLKRYNLDNLNVFYLYM